jgi:hypothetical protein
MKITEDTKIKDLIPEGYEIDHNSTSFPSGSTSIVVPIKRCQNKNFIWYVGQYYVNNLSFLINKSKFEFQDSFISLNYDVIPFGLRIGLLKFICEDLKLTLDDMYHYLRVYYVDDMPSKFDTIYSIVPSEFMDSLTD